MTSSDRDSTVSRPPSLGRQVAAALAHLHARGIVHRDVKPGNILLEADGTARLCDTGLARPLGAGATVTESQMVVGTPAYMAPEQATAAELTAASDVYALGLTLHACLTGSVPHVESTAMATLMRRARSRPPRIRRAAFHCPRWLARLLRRMLEPRPGDRPSAVEVVRMLAGGRVWPRPWRRQLAAAAAVAVVAAVAAGAWQILDRDLAVRVEAVHGELRGLDDSGRRVWSQPLEGAVRQVEHVDLDDDGVEETIIVTGRSLTRGGSTRLRERRRPTGRGSSTSPSTMCSACCRWSVSCVCSLPTESAWTRPTRHPVTARRPVSVAAAAACSRTTLCSRSRS